MFWIVWSDMDKSWVCPSRKLEIKHWLFLWSVKYYWKNIIKMWTFFSSQNEAESVVQVHLLTAMQHRVKLIFDYVRCVTDHLKFSPNFMWRYKKVTASHMVWRWQVYNFGFRENYWCTKYATLAKFHFNFFHIQTMHCCDAQMIYNPKYQTVT